MTGSKLPRIQPQFQPHFLNSMPPPQRVGGLFFQGSQSVHSPVHANFVNVISMKRIFALAQKHHGNLKWGCGRFGIWWSKFKVTSWPDVVKYALVGQQFHQYAHCIFIQSKVLVRAVSNVSKIRPYGFNKNQIPYGINGINKQVKLHMSIWNLHS